MGGNIDEAKTIIQEENLDPLTHFKFFYKYKQWGPEMLEEEVKKGYWVVAPQKAREALRPYSMGL
jgi:putative AlgH/UPF0301 family transcriptional regulator